MKKKSLILILVLAVAATCLCFGCSSKITRESVAEEHKNDIMVSFDIGAGASWNGKEQNEVYFYYPKKAGGTYLADPSKSPFDVSLSLSKPNHFLEGWYKDPDYNDKWDFNSDKATGNITLYAHWLERFRYKFRYKDEDSGDLKEIDYVLYVDEGDTFNPTEAFNNLLPSSIRRAGYTLTGVYSDEACKTPWKSDHKHEGYVENGEQIGGAEYVYTTWIEGEYNWMSKTNDAAYVSSNNNMFVLNDIDFEGNGEAWGNHTATFNKIFDGNNHVIKNITLKFPYDLFGYKGNCGLFGNIGKDAVIKNVTFENIIIEVDDDTLSDVSRYIGLLAGTIESGATFENVKITGKIIIKSMNPSMYTLGLVAGENVGESFAGINFSDVKWENELPGYDVTVDSDGNRLNITPVGV